MQVKVPYTAIEFQFFKSGVELRYCAATGLFEEHDRETVTINSLGIRYELVDEPALAFEFGEFDDDELEY